MRGIGRSRADDRTCRSSRVGDQLNFEVTVTTKYNLSAVGGLPTSTLDSSFMPFDFSMSQQVSDPGTVGSVISINYFGSLENYSYLFALNPSTLRTPLDASLFAFNTTGPISIETVASGWQTYYQPYVGAPYADYYSEYHSDADIYTSNKGFYYLVELLADYGGPSSLADVQSETFADFLANFSAPSTNFSFLAEAYDYTVSNSDFYSEYNGAEYYGTVSLESVDEPGTLLLMLGGLGGIIMLSFRHRRWR